MKAGDYLELADYRRLATSDDVQRKEKVRTVYEGGADVPLPELGEREEPTNANLLKQAVDQQGMRIASVPSDVFFPPESSLDRAQKRSQLKRQAAFGWGHYNNMNLLDRQRARWLVAYSNTPIVVSPEGVDRPELGDTAKRIPLWDPKDPVGAFPSDDSLTPRDCVFVTIQPLSGLRGGYPYLRWVHDPDPTCQIMEWHDADRIVRVAAGQCRSRPATVEADYGRNQITYLSNGPKGPWRWASVLEDIENRAGLCLVVNPSRVCLSVPMGQYDGLIPMFHLQAAMWALQLHAVKRGIFTKEWVVSPDGDAQVVTEADPYQGIVGEIKGGQIVEHKVDPGFASLQAIDRLQEYMRQEGMIPSEWGGLAGSNIRTGRRGEQVMAATVEYAVQEAQELLALSRQAELVRAAEVAKGWHGDKQVSFYVPTKSAKGQVTYRANDLFTATTNVVTYPVTGVDARGMGIDALQRVGAGTMAKKSWMRLDPYIDDPDAEWDQITAETIHTAALQGYAAQAASGEIPWVDLARVEELVVSGKKEFYQAVAQATAEAQERQSEVVPAGSPEAQPGLNMPGVGAEAGVAIPPQPESLGNLASQLVQNARFARAANG